MQEAQILDDFGIQQNNPKYKVITGTVGRLKVKQINKLQLIHATKKQ